MSPFGAALAILLSYLAGSVSFAYLLVKSRRGIDLRSVGSGNLGATNAGRILGRRWAAAIYTLDLLKGLLPTAAGKHLFGDPALASVPLSLLMGAAAFAGHCWPFWLGFKGGKGVATASGVILALAPLVFAIALLVFAIAVLLTRRISVGSLCAALTIPVSWWALGGPEAREGRGAVLLAFFSALAVAVIVLHRKNIGRILAGTEPRIGGTGR